MAEWRTYRLGDLATIVDCEHKTAPPAAPGDEYGYSVGTPHLREGRIHYDTAKRVSKETLEAWSRRATLTAGDLVLAREAPVGQVGRVSPERPTCLGQRTVLVRPDHDMIEERFLHAYLLGRDAQKWMEDRSSGSTVAHLNVADVREIPVALPPLDEQRRIAAVLGALDDLIETNRSLAGQLHDAARAVGLMMLDDFADRPDTPLPEVAAISKGFSYKSAELVPGADTLVNLKNFGRGGVFQHHGFKPLTSHRFKPGQVVEPGDVVISMTDLTQQREVIARPLRVPNVQVEGRMVASLDLAIARPLGGHAREFVAAVLSQESFHSFARNYCNGTTVLHMSVRAFEDYTVPAISPAEAAPFVERIRALNEAEDSCRDEIADLTRTRDELLPLLMSGRVRVADLEGVA